MDATILSVVFEFLKGHKCLNGLCPGMEKNVPHTVNMIPFVILSFFVLPGYGSVVLVVNVFTLVSSVLKEGGYIPLNVR